MKLYKLQKPYLQSQPSSRYNMNMRFLLILFLMGCAIIFNGCVAKRSYTTSHTGKPDPKVARKPGETYYTGYSEYFQKPKQLLSAGKTEELNKFLSEEEIEIRKTCSDDDELVKKFRLVDMLERTSIYLQTGNIEQSIKWAIHAENNFDDRENESYFLAATAKTATWLAEAAGQGTQGRYDPAGFEKVLLLNLKSIGYMLNGDKRSFNVSRLSIQWQDEEKEKFERIIEESKEQGKDSTVDSNSKSNKKDNSRNNKSKNNDSSQNKNQVFSAIANEFSKYNAQALQVPNAFVNPFGDYMTGIVNEFNSVNLPSLMSNAHISYKQALQLNPGSQAIQKSVEATEAKKPASNLVHLVAFDGLAPEKKILAFEVLLPNLTAPLTIEMPTYEPVNSQVKKIAVFSDGGKKLAEFSTVADIETLALRYQKDRIPYIQSQIAASTLRDAFIKETGNAFMNGLGTLAGELIDNSMEHDTSCWMSLPKTIQATRFYASSGLKKIKIISYDKNSHKLSEQNVDISGGDRNFIFVRTLNNTLFAYRSKPIWTIPTSVASND